MEILSDSEWARLKAALDAAGSGTGRPLQDERKTVEAVIWRQRNGAKWRAVPVDLGPWWKAAQLHIRWSRTDVWERVLRCCAMPGSPSLARCFSTGRACAPTTRRQAQKGGSQACPRPLAWGLRHKADPDFAWGEIGVHIHAARVALDALTRLAQVFPVT